MNSERIREILKGFDFADHNIIYIDCDIIILDPPKGITMNAFCLGVYDVMYELRREGFEGMTMYTFNGLKHIVST